MTTPLTGCPACTALNPIRGDVIVGKRGCICRQKGCNGSITLGILLYAALNSRGPQRTYYSTICCLRWAFVARCPTLVYHIPVIGSSRQSFSTKDS